VNIGIKMALTELEKLQKENARLKQTLREERELFLNVSNSIPDLLFFKDTKFRYKGCNQAFSDFVGLPIDFIIGKTDDELFPVEFTKTSKKMDENVVNAFEKSSNKEWINHISGRKVYLHTHKFPLLDTNSQLSGIVGVSRDITQEYNFQYQFEESQHYLIEAQSIAHIGHWDWDITSGELSWSDEIYKIFGYKAQAFEATYEAFLQTIHPDDREMVSQAVNEAIEKHEKYDVYHRVILPNKEEKIVHELGHAIYDKDAKAVQMIGTVQDVTHIHKMQNELQEQKEVFETMFEEASDGMLLLEEGRFTRCNDAVLKILRMSNKEDVLSIHPAEMSPEFQPDGRASFEKAEEMMQKCLNEGSHNFEWVHIRSDGEEFWSEILLTRLYLNNKMSIHVSWRDISERKALEDNLKRSNENFKKLTKELDRKVDEQSAQMIKQSRMAQMGELLSMIAHQWRQPLSTVSAVSNAVKFKISLSDKDDETSTFVYEQMGEIEALIQHLSSTIDDFRTLYKPDKKMQFVSVNEPIHRALKLLEGMIKQHEVRVVKEDVDEINVLMHPNEMMQVILNIIKNAVDNFISKGIENPSIMIEIFVDEKNVRIVVCDNGGGIKEEDLEKVFDPYFSTKEEKNGTGLGLYMSRLILQDHHQGKIEVHNSQEGACFSITLPLI